MAIGTKRIEDYVPVVKYNEGIYTELSMTVASGATVTLPSTTTIGGSAVVALGDITSSSTTATAFTVTNTGIFTGASVVSFVANSLTTGTQFLLTANGVTSGHMLSLSSTGTIVTTGDVLSIAANTATTSTGIVRVSATGLTDGFVMALTGGGANATASGGGINLSLGAATAGTGIQITTTGVYTGTTGMLAITADSATTGVLSKISGNGLTTGTGMLITSSGTMTTTGNLLTLTANSATTAAGLLRINANGLTDGIGAIIASSATGMTSTGRLFKVSHTGNAGVSTIIAEVASAAADETIVFQATASAAITGSALVASGLASVTGKIVTVKGTAATLTTGRYISVDDAAQEVFGIGANGHIHSNTTALAVPPTIAVTTQNGITAAAITSGGSDTCGIITTTGTSTAATVLDVTFGKTYTTAPKAVLLGPANASAAMPNTGYYVSAISATGFTITVAAGGTYAATPSWRYIVIA